MTVWQFLYETTDRVRWPNRWGTVVVLAGDYLEAFDVAFSMLHGRPDVAMVIRLDLVL